MAPAAGAPGVPPAGAPAPMAARGVRAPAPRLAPHAAALTARAAIRVPVAVMDVQAVTALAVQAVAAAAREGALAVPAADPAAGAAAADGRSPNSHCNSAQIVL